MKNQTKDSFNELERRRRQRERRRKQKKKQTFLNILYIIGKTLILASALTVLLIALSQLFQRNYVDLKSVTMPS